MPSLQCSDFAKGFIAPLLLAGEEGAARCPLLLPPDVAPGPPRSYLGPCLPTSLQRLSLSPWMAIYKVSPFFRLTFHYYEVACRPRGRGILF